MNLLDKLRRSMGSRTSHPAGGGHMTWASRSISHSLTSTRLFLKRQIWIWPIIAVVLLSVLGLTVRRSIEATMKQNLSGALQTLVNVQTAMLQSWLSTQENNAQSAANHAETRRIVEQLVSDLPPVEGDAPAPTKEELVRSLTASLGPFISSHDYVGFFLADSNKTIRAATETELVGRSEVPAYDEFLSRALDGHATVSRPFTSVAAIKMGGGGARTGVPTMFACAPVLDQNLQVVGALALRLRPDREFTRIFEMGRPGASGETYAFDRNGLMLSNSRFDRDLKLMGVLPQQEGVQSMLNVLVRDPGGNLAEGFRPTEYRADMDPTRMLASARSGQSAVDVDGYPDYRGVPVVGAWTWLPDYGMGVTTEVDVSQAFAPLNILKRTFWALLGLLVLSSIAIFAFTVMLARAQRQARAAAIEAKQLGQYQLEQKLGAGAMGVVYKGRHAMMRRPTAIKLLDADKVTPQAITRFEREVQITSQLNHPNTVAIYDFGHTPEGVFYYAMEYLEGIDLQLLVDQYGPQPAGRVIHILRQVCGSLYEAHSLGMVHRDVKPANLMLTRRGGEADVVKVLDFGLVRAREDAADGEDRTLAGTPLYMSPEAIQMPASVDGCSDIYAVGAVGYFLLTGHPVFEAASIVDLCNKHVTETPVPPSQRTNAVVPEDLENAILACLEKSRAKRPQTARELSERLARCAAAGEWTQDDAEAWWARHDRGKAQPKTPGAAESTHSRQYEATIDH